MKFVGSEQQPQEDDRRQLPNSTIINPSSPLNSHHHNNHIYLSFHFPFEAREQRENREDRSDMGCASSKRVEVSVAAGVYRPPPTSFAVFDINKIQEPWLITKSQLDDEEECADEKELTKATALPVVLPLLEKLESYESAPKSWSEVSKALEELKPTLTSPLPTNQIDPKAKSEELVPPPESKIKPAADTNNSEVGGQVKKPPPPPLLPRPSSSPPRSRPPELSGFRSVRENSFLVRDREERERQSTAGKVIPWWRRDPLEGYPERRPPGNHEGVVLYTTTLRGVRRTFEDCETARRVVEGHALDAGVTVDERDVSLHGEFLREVRELVGEEEEAAVPRLFVRGRYVGGVEKVVELSETGKLREMMRWVARRSAAGKTDDQKGGSSGGRRECEGCGGARFLPCLECNGSRKVVGDDGKTVERCDECNENGLMLCPLCH
ncbi:uncharacterized protein LOC122018646 [Zingiber officinale]|uniref:Glutaredoxin domain-containing protein n=1 Tax=Zingiber officinale TaxID=94328 RepID=A0A8J5FBY1_ZINOF|nr:uncharacterized protein LOC122018646 [Zingiber officinale]KAG6480469.1 hypothetical protein ZIOFF_063969 [Zingiber officinale]